MENQPVEIPKLSHLESTPPPPSQPPVTQPRKPKALILTLSLITLTSLSAAAYFFFQTQSLKHQGALIPTPVLSINPQPPTSDTHGNWLTYTHQPSNLQFRYPPEWEVTSDTVKAGQTRQAPGKYDITATNSDIHLINILKNSQFEIEITIQTDYDPQKLGGYGPVPNDLSGYKQINIDSRTGLRSKFEDGIALFGGMIPPEPYPLTIVFRRLPHEGTETWPNQDSDSEIVLLFAAQNTQQTASYSITYYSPTFTQSAIENESIDKSLLNEMDLILSTFEFTSTTQPSSTAIQVSKPATTLSHSLPSGWQTITDPTNTFQIGHDSQSVEQIEDSDSLMFKSTTGTKSLQSVFQTTSYNGGSRHLYLQEQMGEPLNEGDKLPDFQEVEYLIQGKKCLVYDGYAISMSPQVWGMCPISSQQALFFNLARNDYLTYLKTIKFL